MQGVEPDQVQLEHNAPQATAAHQEPLHYAPVNAGSDHDRRFQKKVPPTTVAPTYKLTLPSEFVLTHMPDMMNGETFTMVSADGTTSFAVSIVPRRNKDKFEYTVQAKAWKQVVEGLGIKEGDLLEFELTLERNLKVTVMKSTAQTRKPKKMAPAELQATLAKKKAFRGLPMDLTRGLMMQGSQEVMSDLLLPAAAAAAAQGLPIRLPDPNQDALGAASSSQYAANGEEEGYPAGAHAISHGVLQQGQQGLDGDPSQMSKRTADWVQDGEAEQDEAKKARVDGDAGSSPQSRGANGKKGGRQSTGAMNLLASAAEDNEAFENTLTNAQIQQLQMQQQLALQPQLQARAPAARVADMDPRLLLSKHTIDTETNGGMKSLTALQDLSSRLKELRAFQSVEGEVNEELHAILHDLDHHTHVVLDALYRIRKVPKNWM